MIQTKMMRSLLLDFPHLERYIDVVEVGTLSRSLISLEEWILSAFDTRRKRCVTPSCDQIVAWKVSISHFKMLPLPVGQEHYQVEW
jgi:hypothetical protein